jgi:chromosomal replication initiation ATPase DnaA
MLAEIPTTALIDELRRREKINPTKSALFQILHQVAETHGIQANAIISRCQCTKCASARHQFIAVACAVTNACKTDIAQLISRDESTIHYSLHTHPKRLLKNADYKSTWSKLKTLHPALP